MEETGNNSAKEAAECKMNLETVVKAARCSLWEQQDLSGLLVHWGRGVTGKVLRQPEQEDPKEPPANTPQACLCQMHLPELKITSLCFWKFWFTMSWVGPENQHF